MNAAGAAYEAAVRLAHAKHAITRALAFWETWFLIASALYLLGHMAYWASIDFHMEDR